MAIRIQDRDVEIVRAVFTHRFLQPRHIHALLSGSKENLARRCRLLWQHGYLERPVAQRPTKVQTEETVYALGSTGANLLQQYDPKLRIADLEWARTPKRQLGWPYMEHQLGIATFMVCLRVACRQSRAKLHWDGHLNRRAHRLQVEGERFIQPDAFFRLSAPGSKPISCFLEYDRGTVSLERMRDRYFAYFNWWKSQPGKSRLQVLTVTKDYAHMNSLRRVAEDIGRDRYHESTWRALLFAHAGDVTLDRLDGRSEPMFHYADSDRPVRIIPE